MANPMASIAANNGKIAMAEILTPIAAKLLVIKERIL